jgi:hypothetical protein
MRIGPCSLSLPLSAIVYAVAVTGYALTNGGSERGPSEATAIEAVTRVFGPSTVRALQNSTFEPLRKYFSTEQQRNIDQFLQALTDLANVRNRRAQLVGINGNLWWPPTVDGLKVAAVASQDLLCDRYAPPEKITISLPRRSNSHLKITVRETFTEYGQDRVLGKGDKTSIVILSPENGRWVIDEVVSTVHDSGGTNVETLTKLVRDAIKPLRKAQSEISALPPPEVRKAIKARK